MDSRLVHSHTMTTDYNTTLSPIWTAEILPHLTFGDYNKGYVVTFEGNSVGYPQARFLCFSAGVNPTSQSATERSGWMIRVLTSGQNIRRFDLTNDFRASSGTVVKIYEFTM